MHAVIVNTKIKDFEKGRQFLENEVVPRLSQAPGMVAGYWVRVSEDRGVSVIVFESEEAAQAAAEHVEPEATGAVSPESVEVGEVVANI